MKATVYLEHDNGGKGILYNYNGKWWYDIPNMYGFFGEVDLYATNEEGEQKTDIEIAEALKRQYMEWGTLDSDFLDENSDLYLSEYDNMNIDDMENKYNYNPDGMPKGHDEVYWTKICEIDVE